MIGTIAITSSFATNKHQDQRQQWHQQNPDPFQLDRSPSVLQRLKSINFYSYRSPEVASFHGPEEQLHYSFQEHQTNQQQHYAFQEQRTPQHHCIFHEHTYPHLEHREQTWLERSPSIFRRLKSINLYPYLSPEPIRIFAFSHFEEKDVVECRRLMATREREVRVPANVDEEVDAKADNFINKFKQQLRLKKLDSIMRYKEIIGRGRGSAQ